MHIAIALSCFFMGLTPPAFSHSPPDNRLNLCGQKAPARKNAAHKADNKTPEREPEIVPDKDGSGALFAGAPQGNFRIHTHFDEPDKVDIIKRDGHIASSLALPKNFNKEEADIRGCDVSDDEKFILLIERRNKSAAYDLYERVRPFVYKLSNVFPNGGVSDAAWMHYYKKSVYPDDGYPKWTEFLGWRGGSRYLILQLNDGDKHERLIRIKIDTKTGHISKVRN